MQQTAPPPDPHRRRRAAGNASREETRRRLLAAADALFREQGYPATTVAEIAARADVSLQTLYLAWGSKSALLRAATNAAAVAARLPMTHDEWRSRIRAELEDAARSDPGAVAHLAAVTRIFIGVAERAAPYWRMQREAAATDPDIAADRRSIMVEGRRTMAEIAAGMPRHGLRPDLTPEYVTDTLWALASPDVYLLLTLDGGYDAAAAEAWLLHTLTSALCVEGTPRPGTPTTRPDPDHRPRRTT